MAQIMLMYPFIQGVCAMKCIRTLLALPLILGAACAAPESEGEPFDEEDNDETFYDD